jgi:hypothetical protein
LKVGREEDQADGGESAPGQSLWTRDLHLVGYTLINYYFNHNSPLRVCANKNTVQQTYTKKHFDFITVKTLLIVALFGIRVTKPGIQVTNVVTLEKHCVAERRETRPYCSVSRTRLKINILEYFFLRLVEGGQNG